MIKYNTDRKFASCSLPLSTSIWSYYFICRI